MTQSNATNTVEEYRDMILRQVEKVAGGSKDDLLSFYYEKYDHRTHDEKNKFRVALSTVIEDVFSSDPPINPVVWTKELIDLVALTLADEALTKVLGHSKRMLGKKKGGYEERRQRTFTLLSDTIQNIFLDQNDLFRPEWITKFAESTFFNPEKDAIHILLMVARTIPDEFETFVVSMRKHVNTLVVRTDRDKVRVYAYAQEIVDKIGKRRAVLSLGIEDYRLKEILFLEEDSPFRIIAKEDMHKLLEPPK